MAGATQRGQILIEMVLVTLVFAVFIALISQLGLVARDEIQRQRLEYRAVRP